MLSSKIGVLAAVLLCAASPGCNENCPNRGRLIIGRVENVAVEDLAFELKARIDTGAGVSSIDAEIVEVRKAKEPDEPDVIVFKIKDGDGKFRQFERPIVEWAEIKSKGGHGNIKRPVVKLKICLAGKRIEGRVNLAKRGKFLYPLLIGRNLLKMGDLLVDSGRKFTAAPVCE